MTTSERQLRTCLERVDARDAVVLAWAHLDRDHALAQARAADAQGERSEIHGIPVGLKDIIETQDQPTAYGSPIWEGHRPSRDARAVTRLREAGAVIMGKTTTTEFATYHPTNTRNPHNPEHTPGGSSSGSAAAVADAQVTLALGTQTAGSVNRPGSFCGVFTLKPTYGRWPFTGVLPVALTFDTLGGFTRSPQQLAALDRVLSGSAASSDDAPATELPELSGLRIGWLHEPWLGRAEPEALAMVDDVAAQLGTVSKLGRLEVPAELGELQTAHASIQNREAAQALRTLIAPAPSRISPLLAEHLAAGAAMTADEVQHALRVLREVRSFVTRAFEDFDVLLTLAAPGEAPTPRDSTGDPAFNRLTSTAGVPAVGVPVGRGARGLPLGIQLIGPAHGDQALLRVVTEAARVLGVPTPTELPG
jgi:amidase